VRDHVGMDMCGGRRWEIGLVTMSGKLGKEEEIVVLIIGIANTAVCYPTRRMCIPFVVLYWSAILDSGCGFWNVYHILLCRMGYIGCASTSKAMIPHWSEAYIQSPPRLWITIYVLI